MMMVTDYEKYLDELTCDTEKFVLANHTALRLDGTPAYTHLFRVKERLKNLMMSAFVFYSAFYTDDDYIEDSFRSASMLIVALLHDSVEDGILKEEDLEQAIKQLMPSDFAIYPKDDTHLKVIANSVKTLTRRDGVNFENYMMNICEDETPVLLIKLLDRLDNVTFMLDGFSNEKQLEYIEETQKFVIDLVRSKISEDEKEDEPCFYDYIFKFLLNELEFRIQVSKNVITKSKTK